MMQVFELKQRMAISETDIERAREFASAVIGTVDYRDSNQGLRDKVWLDHFISKIGEVAVKKVFEQYGCNVEGPDFAIYEGRQKSWDCDLRINGVALAVKTQAESAAKRYGRSWTFQDAPTRRDTILDQPEAWVCFVACDDEDKSYHCIVYPPFQMKQLVFGEPRLPHLKGKKRVVYADDLRLEI